MRRTLALLVAMVCLAAACGDDTSTTTGTTADDTPSGSTVDTSVDPTSDGPESPEVDVRVFGSLELDDSDRVVICPGVVPPCWPVVDGLDDGTELGLVVAEGTWQADTFGLRSAAQYEPPEWELTNPCEGEDLGTWQHLEAGPEVIQESTPAVAAIWLAPDQRTLVVVVNDDAEGTRTRLVDQGFEGVCVVDLGFDHTLAELETAQQDMADHFAEWGDQGWVLTSSSIEVVRNVVEARFDTIDQRLRSEIDERWGSMVEILAAVEVLEGTVDHLEMPVPDDEIAIALQPRGSAGMGALGRFTLRYDDAADCLWFEADDGSRVKPIWPSGTRALRDPVLVLDGRGAPFVAADQVVELGGGFGQVLPDSDDPTDCGASEVWVIAPTS